MDSPSHPLDGPPIFLSDQSQPLEVSLRFLAERAFLRSVFTLVDMAAIQAFPFDLDIVRIESSLFEPVREKGVPLGVFRLDSRDDFKKSRYFG
jgi:hypothetical protein